VFARTNRNFFFDSSSSFSSVLMVMLFFVVVVVVVVVVVAVLFEPFFTHRARKRSLSLSHTKKQPPAHTRTQVPHRSRYSRDDIGRHRKLIRAD